MVSYCRNLMLLETQRHYGKALLLFLILSKCSEGPSLNKTPVVHNRNKWSRIAIRIYKTGSQPNWRGHWLCWQILRRAVTWCILVVSLVCKKLAMSQLVDFIWPSVGTWSAVNMRSLLSSCSTTWRQNIGAKLGFSPLLYARAYHM